MRKKNSAMLFRQTGSFSSTDIHTFSFLAKLFMNLSALALAEFLGVPSCRFTNDKALFLSSILS